MQSHINVHICVENIFIFKIFIQKSYFGKNGFAIDTYSEPVECIMPLQSNIRNIHTPTVLWFKLILFEHIDIDKHNW